MELIGSDPGSQAAIDIVQAHVFFQPKQGKDWQSKPELPTSQEILAEHSDIDQLPENPVDVPWSSKDEYLTAQYEILRREAIEGLRYSVRSVAEYRRPQPMMDDDFTNIYTQVRVKQYLLSTIGPLARVSFSTERSKYRIQWKQSTRLQPGKIVALTPKHDNFKTICKIASIAQRPYKDGLDQDPPLIDLLWARPEDAVLDPTLEMVMVESLHGYFESARHALVGLQHAAQTNSPLDKYLTGAHNKDNHPKFLKENPIMDLSALASRATPDDADVVAELRSHDIVNSKAPNLKGLTFLDESQLLGLRRIVSQELAIVQGPPGTGKTYTSVEAIKTMVANRRRHGGPPILVAAQTNHALDQLLAHCIKSDLKVLRMGGRTQNDQIKPFVLFELRSKCSRLPADNKCRLVDNKRRVNAQRIQELTDALFSDRLLDPDALLQFGIMTVAQHQSLADESMETHVAVEGHGPFALWLGDSLIPAKIREERHPTQLELNEAEARKNLPEFDFDDDDELENIGYDDSDEDLCRLRGSLIKLNHVWTGKDPARLTSWDRAIKRALRTDDLYSIDKDLRGAVYQHFQAKLLDAMASRFAALLAENIKLCKERKALKFLGNSQLVERQRIDIVGCTTTGLSKYRGCLAAMQPRSLLIEEAAETREANIVSALYPSVQQLILVGDHKQLAPKCDVQRLGDAPYNLNVSLFQRLVNLNMPFVMLNQQRRMKPELRQLLTPFYPDLFDHPSVESSNNNRPDVLGMGGRNSWLFDHIWPEDTNSDYSKFNEQEAEMITNFFAYLVSNGTLAEKITVLTFYKGQRKVLLRKLKRHPSLMGSDFNVCTVDSYQGEENDIVLLSLVRSPQPDRPYAVGFLEDERRAVVAISRARRGFYVFGNVDNVLGAHQGSRDLWFKICSGFAKQGRINDGGLPIVCQPHGRESWIKELDDWGNKSGGCDQPCNQTRHCGHSCALNCHAIAHEYLPCSEPCREKLVCGHGCQNLCGQTCSCDCQTFKEVHRPAHTVAKQGIEQRLIQMGAEESVMLRASESHRNASRLLPTPLPAAKHLQNKGRVGPAQPLRPPTAAQVVETAAEWGRYVENIDQHDEVLRLEHQADLEAAAGNQPSEGVIRDVYRPTSLMNGQRVGAGGKVVHNVPLTYSQAAAAASTNGQPAQISNGPGHTQGGHPSNFSAAANGFSQSAGNSQLGHGGGKGSQEKVPENGGRNQPISVQQPVQETPVQQPLPRFGEEVYDLLIGISLDDSTSHTDTSGSIELLAGHEVTPQLLAQSGSVISPPPGFPTPNNISGTQPAAPTHKSDKEEEWLIEF